MELHTALAIGFRFLISLCHPYIESQSKNTRKQNIDETVTWVTRQLISLPHNHFCTTACFCNMALATQVK